MPKGAGTSEQPETATELRRRAGQIRRLMAGVALQADRDRLSAFAEELEARAAERERSGQDELSRHIPLAERSVAALRTNAQDYRQMAMTATTEAAQTRLERLAVRLETLADQRAQGAGRRSASTD